MKLSAISTEYSLTDADDNIIGVAKVERKGDDSSLELSLGDKLHFETRDEFVAFVDQIINIMQK